MNEEYKDKLLKRIREEKEKKGLNSMEIAKASSVSYPTLLGILNGATKNPQPKTLYSIAKTVGLTDAEIQEAYNG